MAHCDDRDAQWRVKGGGSAHFRRWATAKSLKLRVRDVGLLRDGRAGDLARNSHYRRTILMMKKSSNPPGFPTRSELLLGRARRAQQRGERRQALVALREATLLEETNAKLWALYGSASAKANRLDEAERAFTQAIYLRQRQHDAPRVNALRGLIRRLGFGNAA